MKTFWACVAVLQTVMHTAEAAKILLLPTMAKSHAFELLSVGEELARRGHQVSIYLPASHDAKIPKESMVNVIAYNIPKEYKTTFDDKMADIQSGEWKGKRSILDTIYDHKAFMKALCWGIFADRERLEYLRHERFDLVIVTALPFTHCLFSLPYYLNVSTVASSAYISGRDSGTPLQSNTLLFLGTLTQNEMNVFERFVNSLQNIIIPFLLPYIIAPDMSQIDPMFSNIDITQLMRHAVLYLENSDYIFDYPKAIFPNLIQVGGLTTKPAKSLDKTTEDFMARSPKGIILVSFGSLVPIHYAPKSMMDTMLTALRQSGYNVLLKSNSDHDDGNIRFSKWLPQNDILGHPKTVLFISHCGKNGLFESIYHGVPILCTPRSIDQPAVAKMVVKRGIGLNLDFNHASVQDISNAIYEIMHNQTYRENMRKLSVMFHDRAESPAERAASAVEHVLKYGSQHMTPPTSQLTMIQYSYADVWFVIYGILFICLFVLFKCCQKITILFTRKQKVKVN